MPTQSIEKLLNEAMTVGLGTFGTVFFDEADPRARPPYIVWSLIDNDLSGNFLASSGTARVQVDIYAATEFVAADMRNSCGRWLRDLFVVKDGVTLWCETASERSFRKGDGEPYHRGVIDLMIAWKE